MTVSLPASARTPMARNGLVQVSCHTTTGPSTSELMATHHGQPQGPSALLFSPSSLISAEPRSPCRAPPRCAPIPITKASYITQEGSSSIRSRKDYLDITPFTHRPDGATTICVFIKERENLQPRIFPIRLFEFFVWRRESYSHLFNFFETLPFALSSPWA